MACELSCFLTEPGGRQAVTKCLPAYLLQSGPAGGAVCACQPQSTTPVLSCLHRTQSAENVLAVLPASFKEVCCQQDILAMLPSPLTMPVCTCCLLSTCVLSTPTCLPVVAPGYYVGNNNKVLPCPTGEWKSGYAANTSCTRCIGTGVTTAGEGATSITNCSGVFVVLVAASKAICAVGKGRPGPARAGHDNGHHY